MPSGTYVLLGRVQLNTTVASVSLSNIPQSGYTDLVVLASARTNRAGTTSDGLYMSLNGNGGTNFYSLENIDGTVQVHYTPNYGGGWVGTIPTTSASSGSYGNMRIYITNYLATGIAKSYTSDSAAETASATMFSQAMEQGTNTTTTGSVNSISFSANGSFVSGTTFSVYGVSAVGATPTILPKATGGAVTNDGTYWYHTFASSGYFVPSKDISCDILQIGAGGGGSGNFGGGGGAGGLVYNSSQSLTTGIYYSAIVGAGGVDYQNGSTTSFSGGTLSLTQARGGGGGGGGVGQGSTTPQALQAGGCGGGGGGNNGSINTNTTAGGVGSQGFNGGTGNFDRRGGGGGGMGGVGANAGSTGGNGGSGINTYSTWASATGTGASGFYCGGGGGGTYGSTAGTGTNGGGNGGTVGNDGTAATINSGSGGGGGGGNNSGGNGSNGLVIIRYTMAV